jgi:hypothetical protein
MEEKRASGRFVVRLGGAAQGRCYNGEALVGRAWSRKEGRLQGKVGAVGKCIGQEYAVCRQSGDVSIARLAGQAC